MGGVQKCPRSVLRKKTGFAPEHIQIPVDDNAAVLFTGQGMWGTESSGVEEAPLVRAHIERPQFTHLQA